MVFIKKIRLGIFVLPFALSLVVPFVVPLAGCSMLGLNKPQANSAAASVASAASAPNHPFKLSLLGGTALNVSSAGVARPVQVCIYVARNRDWQAPLVRKQSTCAEPSADPNLLQSQRVVLAPGQQNHINLPMEGGRDAWLVLDADFAQPRADQTPLVFLMNRQHSQLDVTLNGNGVLSEASQKTMEGTR